jgi:hypothetical protein
VSAASVVGLTLGGLLVWRHRRMRRGANDS